MGLESLIPFGLDSPNAGWTQTDSSLLSLDAIDQIQVSNSALNDVTSMLDLPVHR